MAVEAGSLRSSSHGLKLFSLHGLQQGVGLAPVALGCANRLVGAAGVGAPRGPGCGRLFHAGK